MAGTRRFKRNQRPKRMRASNNENVKKESGDSRRISNYEPIVRENSDLVKYYQAQKIVPEGEWEDFTTALKKDLPTAFRISACSADESQKMLEIVRGDFFKGLVNAQESSSEKKIPFCLPWYPNNLGWQVEVTRNDIRRCEDFFRLHNFLIAETQTGRISRQETVSMIPPIALDVQPHHKVLDLCAAPGSKTAQLVELLHSQDKPPTGFVVANDIDNSRCYMLVHQAKRLNSPCVVITNHDASNMPNFYQKNADGSESVVKFDRVLCDVPCTGDGTLRKNPDIWLKWNAANGNNLHGVQFRILKRGLEMLEVGGYLVYSTCSFNPIENEAVICRMLSQAEGSIELVEAADRLPGLKFVRGVSSWSPASKDLSLYTSFDQVDPKWHTQVRPQMFPPSDPNQFPLERCLRILPHHQNTGGFFIALLKKVSTLPWEKARPAEKSADKEAPSEVQTQSDRIESREDAVMVYKDEEDKSKPPSKKKRIMGYKEDPFVFFKEDEPVWNSIKAFYEIEGLQSNCLLTRCLVGKKKNIYYVTPPLKQLVELNQTRVKIINTGVKVFSRCDSKGMECEFRFVQEGLDSIKCYVGAKRRISVTRDELEMLLCNIDPKFPPQTDSLQADTQQALISIGQGSCIIDYDGEVKITMVGWKGVKSLRAYIPLSDAVHYLRLIGGDVSIYERNKFKKANESKNDADKDEQKPEEGNDILDNCVEMEDQVSGKEPDEVS